MRRFAEKIYKESIGEAIDAEWLNTHLNAGKPFTVWIGNQITHQELIEGVDYIKKRLPTAAGGMKVIYLLTISAATMIALSDRGSVGRKIRRHYSAAIGSLDEAYIDDDIEPKTSVDDVVLRKPILKVARNNAVRSLEATHPVRVQSLPLPDKWMSVDEFVSTIAAPRSTSVSNLIHTLFHYGYVDHEGWPVEGCSWLREVRGELYIHAAQSDGAVRYEVS